MRSVFLGIDTSNYTTSVAVCGTDGKVSANLKRPVTVAEGERGIRQSDAVFAHVKNFPLLSAQLRDELKNCKVMAVGVSSAPRAVSGSYMPCFLTGVAVAETVAAAVDAPLYTFSHQDGHIAAAAYSSGAIDSLLENSFIAFHVSGGSTEAFSVSPDEDNAFKVEKIGGTADISMGQLIDRVGVHMGLRFPCGSEMEKLALTNTERLPAVKVCVEETVCNLSGLENKAVALFDTTHNVAMTAAFVFSCIEKTLYRMTENCLLKYPGSPVLFSGGVMSNHLMRERLSSVAKAFFAEPAFSADNAAGISLLTYKKAKKNGLL